MGSFAKRNEEYQAILDSSMAVPTPDITVSKGKPLPYHEEYQSLALKYKFLEASYRGGAKYKSEKDSQGCDILIKHEQESEKAWARRKRMSTCHNFCRPLVDKMVGFVFSQPITRDVSEVYTQWADDVDGNDVCLPDFVKYAVLKACQIGRWYVMLDTTKPEPDMTVAQATAIDARIVISHLHPSRVIHWNDNELLVTDDKIGEYGGARLWNKVTYQDILLGKDGRVAVIEAPVVHGWTAGMPIVCVKGQTSEESLIEDVAELQMSIFNLDSLLREELSKNTFSQYWMACPSASGDMLQALDVGSRKVIVIPVEANTVKFERLSSDATQAESIRQSIEFEISEIYRTMGLKDPLTETGGPESGRALKIRFTESAFRASEISDMACTAEERITDLVSEAMGIDIACPEYPEEFDEENLAEELTATLSVISADLPSSCKRAQVDKWAGLAFGKRLETEEMIEMRQEIEEKYSAEAEAAKAYQEQQEGIVNGKGGGGKEEGAVDGDPAFTRKENLDMRKYQNPAYAPGSKAPKGPMHG